MDIEFLQNDFIRGLDSDDPFHIRKTYIRLMQHLNLHKFIGIPPWPKIEKFLARCWREVLSHPKDNDTTIRLNGYEAALDICPFLGGGNGLKGYDEKVRHGLIQVLYSIYVNGNPDSRLCIETAIVEGLSKDDLKYWRKCNRSSRKK